MEYHTGYFDASIDEYGVRLSGLLEYGTETVFEYCVDFQPVKSIKFAEHMALLQLLNYLKEYGYTNVYVLGDAKDIINVINGKGSMKYDRDRYKTAKSLLAELNSSVDYINRRDNKAHYLFRQQQ